MRHRVLAILLLIAWNAGAQDIEDQLTMSLKGKTLTLRSPAAGDKLRYDEAGALQKGSPGVRGIDELIAPESFQLRNDVLAIKGDRLATLIDPYTGTARLGIVSKVELQLKLPDGATESSKVSAAIHKVFADEERMRERSCDASEQTAFAQFVAHVRESMATRRAKAAPPDSPSKMICMLDGSRGYEFGIGLTPPKAIKTPDPSYPQALKSQRLQPTVQFIIRVDENGAVTDIITVATPDLAGAFSSGFVLRKWEFRPAMLGGIPVPAIIGVEINFHLN